MKRVIVYTAEDGKEFNKWREARKHEVILMRKKRISACLHRIMKTPGDKASVTMGSLIQAVCDNAGEVAEALSARASARAMTAVPKSER